MRRILVVLWAGALLVIGALPAFGHGAGIYDPDDVDNRLDIRRVGYAHGGGETTLRMRMHDPFRTAVLLNGVAQWVLSTNSGPQADVAVQARARRRADGSLRVRCRVYAPDGSVGRYGGSRPAPDVVKCVVPTQKVGGIAEHFSGQSQDGRVSDSTARRPH